jgi:hypothetical protein
MSIESFFPTAIICDFVTNDDMNHNGSPQLRMNNLKIRKRRRIGNGQMHTPV